MRLLALVPYHRSTPLSISVRVGSQLEVYTIPHGVALGFAWAFCAFVSETQNGQALLSGVLTDV